MLKGILHRNTEHTLEDKPIILATQEAGAGGLKVQSLPGQLSETLSQNKQTNQSLGPYGIECFSKYEALKINVKIPNSRKNEQRIKLVSFHPSTGWREPVCTESEPWASSEHMSTSQVAHRGSVPFLRKAVAWSSMLDSAGLDMMSAPSNCLSWI